MRSRKAEIDEMVTVRVARMTGVILIVTGTGTETEIETGTETETGIGTGTETEVATTDALETPTDGGGVVQEIVVMTTVKTREMEVVVEIATTMINAMIIEAQTMVEERTRVTEEHLRATPKGTGLQCEAPPSSLLLLS